MDTSDMCASGILEMLQWLNHWNLTCLCALASVSTGLHMIVKQTFPQAVYVYCNSHRLIKASKVSGHFNTFFDTTIYMTDSSRHARFVEAQKELRPRRPCSELEWSKDMTWSSKSGAVSKILTFLNIILEVLSLPKAEVKQRLRQSPCSNKQESFTFEKSFQTSDFATEVQQYQCLSEFT